MATFNLFKNDDLLNNKQFHKKNTDLSLTEICVKNAVAASTLLIACFMGLCVLTHTLEINQLSAINLFILAFGVYYALRDYSPAGKGGSIDYFKGFKIGFYTAMIAVFIHAGFIGIYTTLDPTLLNQVSKNPFWNFNTPALGASAIALFEGVAAGFIITFCMMQYFKKQ